MSDVTYRVVAELDTQGSLDSGLTKAQGKLASMDNSVSKMGSGLGSFASTLNDAFTGAVEKAASIGFTIAKWGVAGAFGGLIYGITQINAKLEATQMSMASIFTANDMAPNMAKGMDYASRVMEKIRRDSEVLPVSFQDVAQTMKMISTATFHSGGSINDAEKLAARGSAFANIEGISNIVAARSISTLLAGHATSANPIVRLLGIDPKGFKNIAPEKRMETVSEGLGKYVDAASGTFSKSFRALFTTLRNDAEFDFLGRATSPLFGRVKNSMSEAHQWVVKNRDEIHMWMDYFGQKMAEAWDKGIKVAKEWIPILWDFSRKAAGEIHELWTKIEPIVKKVVGYIETLLKNPDKLFSGIKKILEAYAELKIGGMVAPGIAEGVAGIAGAAGAAGAGLIGGATVITIGGAVLSIEQALKDSADARNDWRLTMDNVNESLKNLGKSASDAEPFVKKLGTVLGGFFISELRNVSDVVHIVTGAISKRMSFLRDIVDPLHVAQNDWAATKMAHVVKKAISDKFTKEDDALDKKGAANKVKNGGATNIARIEINVTQSGDPSRVARAVMDKLADLKRYPKSSKWVPNYSGGT